VGVNLPCYLVIIKGTLTWQESGCRAYTDLEIMQMLGRAGRPQFETSAVAVIITKSERVNYFEKMVSGQEYLESCLHQNLINHLNAEIGLGTVNDLQSAKRWLVGTFLYVRLGRNPDHYKIDEAGRRKDINDWLEHICKKDISLLEQTELIEPNASGRLRCTVFGDAMAKYYVKFETMKLLLSLPPKAKMSEMVSSTFTIELLQLIHSAFCNCSSRRVP
jgi:ATP-dependent DNA helicase HFM1/MER3